MADFSTDLDRLREQSLLRVRRVVETACAPELVVDGRPLLAFCSNDYLGLAGDARLVAAAKAGADLYGVGSGASHLISGHYSAHHQLEERLAAFVGMARALFFSTGYMANIAAITALTQCAEGAAAVFSDALNHASLIDGIRLSGAEKQIYPHGDLATLERQLAQSTATRKLVVSDAVFSMDGDLAPLPGLLALCERHDAYLLVDDAHGFGVLGARGQGSLAHFDIVPAAHPRLVYVGTLGKAAGVAGAFVAGAEDVIEWLLQRARTYIFTTGAPPMLAHALLTSLDLIEQGAARRAHLQVLVDQFRHGLQLQRWRLLDTSSPIQPLIVGENSEVLRVGKALLDQGLWVPAIRPPTVPAGTARLRITLSAAHSTAQVARLVAALNAQELRA
ncbi:MAG: 8-amino-7-oxononanoate synthase [Sterolibacterium sp.]|nr:8-amino-7-oxononanoate synthase [Sterolibacterium sp.]